MRWETILETRGSAPKNIHVQVTNGCNLRCAHCYGLYGYPHTVTYIPPSIWKTFVSDAYAQGVQYLNLSGGEVTTYPQLDTLFATLKEYSFPTYLTTNGTLPEKIWQIVEKYGEILIGVKVSIDGASSKSYRYIRDPEGVHRDLWRRVLTTLKLLKEYEIEITAATLIHQKNIEELTRMPRLLAQYGVSRWIIAPLLIKGGGEKNIRYIVGDYREYLRKILDPSFLRGILEACKEENIVCEIADIKYVLFLNRKRAPYFSCGGGISYMSVTPELHAYPCPLLPYTNFASTFRANLMVNEKYYGIKCAWNSKQFKLWVARMLYLDEDCPLRGVCGGCPIQADLEGMEFYATPTFCKSLWREVFNDTIC